MADVRIVNASPLIALAAIGLQDLLAKLSGRVIVPEAVVREILAGNASDPARRLIEAKWGDRASEPEIAPAIHAWGLGAGESSVIALALVTPVAEVILDDAPARRCARSFGLPVRGTVGVLLLAKKRGLVPSVKDRLLELKTNGFFIDDALLDEAIRLAGEV
ncbi:MAG: DUF3368 domain-containing protein [Planctomycetota bacterium]